MVPSSHCISTGFSVILSPSLLTSLNSYSKYAISTYYIISSAEAASNLSRYDGVRYGVRESNEDVEKMYVESRTKGFGDEVKRRIMIGNYVLSSGFYDAYYKKASQVRRLIRDDFSKALKEVDVLLTPVSPTTAFKKGEKITDPVQMYLGDIFTVSINMAGLPAIFLINLKVFVGKLNILSFKNRSKKIF